MDSLVFAEFCEHLTEQLQREEAKMNGQTSEILPMAPMDRMVDAATDETDKNLNDSVDKAPIPSSKTSQADDEDELLRLDDGTYPRLKKESVI